MANSLKTLINDAYVSGKYCYSTFRKVSAIAAVAGYWVDLSMTTGNPVPNYYVGQELMATVPDSWYKKGIWHGGAVTPGKKYLHKICMFCGSAAGAPCPYLLCDYLMYYPLIDMDNTDEQFLTNYGVDVTSTTDPEAAVLPRYASGQGVQAFLVATNPYVGGAYFQINYTNERNETGRISQVTLTNTSTYIGTIINSHTAGANRYGSFIPLRYGDSGIKSIQSITFSQPNGGLAVLVLVRPLATLMTMEPTAWAEFDFVKDKPSLPRIYDGAYLNFLAMPSATIAAIPVIGEITTIWGD